MRRSLLWSCGTPSRTSRPAASPSPPSRTSWCEPAHSSSATQPPQPNHSFLPSFPPRPALPPTQHELSDAEISALELWDTVADFEACRKPQPSITDQLVRALAPTQPLASPPARCVPAAHPLSHRATRRSSLTQKCPRSSSGTTSRTSTRARRRSPGAAPAAARCSLPRERRSRRRQALARRRLVGGPRSSSGWTWRGLPRPRAAAFERKSPDYPRHGSIRQPNTTIAASEDDELRNRQAAQAEHTHDHDAQQQAVHEPSPLLIEQSH